MTSEEIASVCAELGAAKARLTGLLLSAGAQPASIADVLRAVGKSADRDQALALLAQILAAAESLEIMERSAHRGP